MFDSSTFYDLVFENMRKLAFPEELLNLDKTLAKQDLISLLMIERVGECTMTQLAEHMNFPTSTMTGIVDRLVKKGFVERYRSEQDRRIVLINLTDHGLLYASQTKTSIVVLVTRLSETLTESEKMLIFSLIEKIIKVFSVDNEKANETSSQNSIKNIPIE